MTQRDKLSQAQGISLKAANNYSIPTYDTRELRVNVDISLHRAFRWSFLFAEVSQPILGADFVKSSNEFETISSEFPRIRELLIHNLSVKHKVQHHIVITATPHPCKGLSPLPRKFFVAKAEFDCKCEIERSQLSFLGHLITAKELSPSQIVSKPLLNFHHQPTRRNFMSSLECSIFTIVLYPITLDISTHYKLFWLR